MSPTENARFHLELLRAYLDSTSDAIFVLCDEMKFLVCNAVAERWFGYSEAELTRHNQRVPITHLLAPAESAQRFRKGIERALRGETPIVFECPIQLGDAPRRWVDFSINRVRFDGGVMVIVVGRDTSAERAAREEMQKLSHAVEQTADIVMITDIHGITEYVNPAFEAATGYAQQETLGRRPGFLSSGRHDVDFYRNLWRTILAGRPFHGLFVNRRKDGGLYYEEKTISPMTNAEGKITHFVATGKDVTQRIEDLRTIDYLSHYDALTGLPNRALARDRLERAIANAQPEGQRVALVLLDLDRFKDVNDSLGHVAGDALIREAAARLKACVRDIDTVARMGSDEFALILEGISDVVDIDDLAAGVLSAFTDPFLLGDHNVVTPVSMGITVYPDDGSSSRELLVNAEAAMANAKESGGGVYRFFTADITARIRSRMTLEQELRRALEREEFVLHYQPIVDLRTRAVEAVEALVRWHHPTRGLVGPGEFIPLMEETGLIKPLGACILRSVCAQGRAWQSRYLRTPRISINVSASQFADPGFVDTVLGNLGACCLDNGIIEFEITESVFMHNLDTIHETLEALAGLGVSLALDDFGTGYSALSYLTRFRIDTLKIDRSFVRDLSADSDHAAIVTAVIAMARSLRLNVVAEGVEAQEELDFLRDRGCQLAQGELIAAPQPVVMLDRLLERGVPELLEPLVPREGAE